MLHRAEENLKVLYAWRTNMLDDKIVHVLIRRLLAEVYEVEQRIG